ncbi:GMC oxidoreductase [Gracilibacillus sp. YIM 98692]|uniref:GMC oxidoreductase n=1 Tax=Gracilibacillus sp. YIM 98692 TaxID=2663532 RepID=UPI001F09E4DD|nr:GMC oxidoreductase [Gracilibacillus sp. YIM 98692]
MRIYIANHNDSLQTISKKFHVNIDELMSLNPNIDNPNLNISGKVIKLACQPKSDNSKLNSSPKLDDSNLNLHWIPLTSLDEMEKTDYDVLIVGSGGGGGAALWRLCQQWQGTGKKIGVVEAGDLLLQTHVNNLPTMNPERAEDYFLHHSREVSDISSREVIALGGRTLFWLGATPRMSPSTFEHWPIKNKQMEKYYNIAEKLMNVTKDYTQGSSITEVLLQRLQASYFPDAIDQPIATDLQSTKYGEVHSNVFYSSLSALGRALNMRSFDLAVNAQVVKVFAEHGKVKGIEVMSSEKKRHFLKAKTIILSAGTFQTTRILLNSDIKGPAIGHYLTHHSRIYATGRVTREEFPELLGTLGILVPGQKDRPYQIQIIGPEGYFWYPNEEQKPLQEDMDIYFHASGEVESYYENQIIIDPNEKDHLGIPKVDIRFTYSERDRAVIDQMKKAVRAASSAMKTQLIEETDQPYIYLWPFGKEFHEMGTCRMGDDPNTSATNYVGQIHGINGLYVADNSVIPTSGTANPTLTTVALAIRTVDYIVDQFK